MVETVVPHDALQHLYLATNEKVAVRVHTGDVWVAEVVDAELSTAPLLLARSVKLRLCVSMRMDPQDAWGNARDRTLCKMATGLSWNTRVMAGAAASRALSSAVAGSTMGTDCGQLRMTWRRQLRNTSPTRQGSSRAAPD